MTGTMHVWGVMDFSNISLCRGSFVNNPLPKQLLWPCQHSNTLTLSIIRDKV